MVSCEFFFGNKSATREVLFKKAFQYAKFGKVMYILQSELDELPQLSQDYSTVDRNYIKMMSFLYMPNLISLVDGITTLPHWKKIPSTIILDDLSEYCNKDTFQNACAVAALLLDTACSCSATLNSTCRLYISCRKDIMGEENCKVLNDLYSRHENLENG